GGALWGGRAGARAGQAVDYAPLESRRNRRCSNSPTVIPSQRSPRISAPTSTTAQARGRIFVRRRSSRKGRSTRFVVRMIFRGRVRNRRCAFRPHSPRGSTQGGAQLAPVAWTRPSRNNRRLSVWISSKNASRVSFPASLVLHPGNIATGELILG